MQKLKLRIGCVRFKKSKRLKIKKKKHFKMNIDHPVKVKIINQYIIFSENSDY